MAGAPSSVVAVPALVTTTSDDRISSASEIGISGFGIPSVASAASISSMSVVRFGVKDTPTVRTSLPARYAVPGNPPAPKAKAESIAVCFSLSVISFLVARGTFACPSPPVTILASSAAATFVDSCAISCAVSAPRKVAYFPAYLRAIPCMVPLLISLFVASRTAPERILSPPGMVFRSVLICENSRRPLITPTPWAAAFATAGFIRLPCSSSRARISP